MYHYVREIRRSEFPGIKGLEVEGFRRQLDHLAQNYNFVTADQVVAAAKYGHTLPEDAVWLTFDDGYKDHHMYVLPELVKRGVQGSFFVPSKPILDRVVMDVNSVHYILASGMSPNSIAGRLNHLCLESGVTREELSGFWAEYAVGNRFDSAEIIYIKRMLQHALPMAIRGKIVDTLLKEFVKIDSDELAQQLYLTVGEVRELIDAGMYVGGHSHSHVWLDREFYDSQLLEVNQSLDFLVQVGAASKDWIMAYPYGAYNNNSLDILAQRDCAVAVTTEVRTANLLRDNPLTLPRFDANDFPS